MDTTAKLVCGSGEVQIPVNTDCEEAFWKPVGQAFAALDITAPDAVTILYGDNSAQIVIEDDGTGKVKITKASSTIRLKRSCYGVKKLRRIDAGTGSHSFYDLVPNNMGPMTLDVGARYGQTGGTNAGADLVEGAYVLRSPMPSFMYWPKYYWLLKEGYRDYTEDVYDGEEDIMRLEKLFGDTEKAPETDEDDTVLKVNSFFESIAKGMLSSLNIDFLSSKPPFNRRQVTSAWKKWNGFSLCHTARDANAIITDLLAITDVSFKNGKSRLTVRSFMVKESDDPKKQQDYIDNAADYWEKMIHSMEAVIAPPAKAADKKNRTASPFGNITMEMASEEETQRILKKFRAEDSLIYKVVKVSAPDFDERQEKYAVEHNIDTFDEFIHGSSTANWKSIVMNGLLLNPDAPIHGKAYGYGLYTARDFVKSLGYTDFRGSKWAGGDQPVGVIGVYRAAYGKPLFPEMSRFGSYEDNVKKGGYGCLDAKSRYSGYRMDEIVFYDEAALSLEYLIFFAEKGEEEELGWL